MDTFTWRPDGRALALTRRQGDDTTELVEFDLDSGELRRLATGRFRNLAYSPDGSVIAAIRPDPETGVQLGTDLWTVTTGSRPVVTRLTTQATLRATIEGKFYCESTFIEYGFGPAGPLLWSRDGRYLAFTDNIDHRAQAGKLSDVVVLEVSTRRRTVVHANPPIDCEEYSGVKQTSLFPIGWR